MSDLVNDIVLKGYSSPSRSGSPTGAKSVTTAGHEDSVGAIWLPLDQAVLIHPVICNHITSDANYSEHQGILNGFEVRALLS